MARKNRESNAMTIMAFIVGVLLVVSVFALYNGNIPIPTTTPTTPPTTTLAPQDVIPVGKQPMDWRVKWYNKLYDENDNNEEASTDLDFYIFLQDPRGIKPRGSVQAMVQVIDNAIDNGLYYGDPVNNTSGWTELLSSAQITDLLQRGTDKIWIVLWDPDWGSTSSYANATDWWDVVEIPMSRIVKWCSADLSTIPDFDDPVTGSPTSPEAYKPIGDVSLSISTTSGKATVEIQWKSCVDASNDTNDKGEWIVHYDQPILVKITCSNYTSSTDSIDDIKYNGKSIFFEDVANSGTWYAYLDASMIGDGSDGSLSTEDLEIYYTGFTTGDEQITVTVYAAALAGWKYPYPGYNYTWVKPGNPTATTALGPQLAATSATDMS